MRLRRRRAPSPVGPWHRPKLLLALSAVGVLTVAIVLGLIFAIRFAMDSRLSASPADDGPETTAPAWPTGDPRTASGEQQRQQIAAAPMLDAGPTGYRPAAPDTTVAETIVIPPATAAGPEQVPTGFPHTPEGAVGQLAAIETTVLQAMDIRLANDVYEAWSQPGGVGGAEWDLTRATAAFLGRTGGTTAAGSTTVVVATPAAGQIKGTDGPDWVVACVLLKVDATVKKQASIGFGHCEAMAWDDPTERWVIAAGPPAARAPSTWPGTAQAREAGWREWVFGS